MVTQIAQRDASAHGDLAGQFIHGVKPRQTSRTKNHRWTCGPVMRGGYRATDQSGVAALGMNRNSIARAHRDQGSHFVGGCGTHHRQRRPVKAPRPIDEVIGHHGRISDDVSRADDRRQLIKNGHDPDTTGRPLWAHANIPPITLTAS